MIAGPLQLLFHHSPEWTKQPVRARRQTGKLPGHTTTQRSSCTPQRSKITGVFLLLPCFGAIPAISDTEMAVHTTGDQAVQGKPHNPCRTQDYCDPDSLEQAVVNDE